MNYISMGRFGSLDWDAADDEDDCYQLFDKNEVGHLEGGAPN